VLTGIVKQFGRFAALRGVSASFEAGRFYVVLGDNGAGKSTLLRVIAGLTRPTRGTVEIFGSSNLKDAAPQIGYMAHASLLYDEMSGMENLRYFAHLYGMPDDRKCAAAIASVGLDPSLTRRADQYSQGMRQRLSLARAVLHDPRILLLDEPFSNVDVVSAREMARLLGSMRDAGRTIFLVTHQPAVVEAVADESVWMQAGLVVERHGGIGAAPDANSPPPTMVRA